MKMLIKAFEKRKQKFEKLTETVVEKNKKRH